MAEYQHLPAKIEEVEETLRQDRDAPKSLVDVLPAELLMQIFNYMTQERELAIIALTCRNWFKVSLPLLYSKESRTARTASYEVNGVRMYRDSFFGSSQICFDRSRLHTALLWGANEQEVPTIQRALSLEPDLNVVARLIQWFTPQIDGDAKIGSLVCQLLQDYADDREFDVWLREFQFPVYYPQDKQLKSWNCAQMFQRAIRHRPARVVRRLLEQGQRITSADDLLIEARDAESLDLLMKYGANPFTRVRGRNASYVFQAILQGRPVLLKRLLKIGVEFIYPEYNYPKYECALSYAIGMKQGECIDILLDHGFDPLKQNSQGLSPLSLAAMSGSPSNLSQFIRHGVDINTRDSNGDTVLHICTSSHRVHNVAFLLNNGANVFIENYAGETPLKIALQNPSSRVTRLIVDRVHSLPDKGKGLVSPLSVAMDRRGNRFFAYAMGRILDWDSEDELGQTMITLIAKEQAGRDMKAMLLTMPYNWDKWDAVDKSGNTALYWALQSHDRAMCRRIARKTANIEAQCSDGRCMLSVAACEADEINLRRLLIQGADVNGRDIDGRTPLSHSAENNTRLIMLQLLRAGARLDLADNNGKTPLDWAIAKGFADDFLKHVESYNQRPEKGIIIINELVDY